MFCGWEHGDCLEERPGLCWEKLQKWDHGRVIDRAGRREGPRVVMRNPKDLPVLPHRKSSYSPEHPKTCKLQCVEGTKPGQTAPLEPSGATERGKLFQDVEGRVQQGQSTAQRGPVIHCAGLRSPCPLCTCFSC